KQDTRPNARQCHRVCILCPWPFLSKWSWAWLAYSGAFRDSQQRTNLGTLGFFLGRFQCLLRHRMDRASRTSSTARRRPCRGRAPNKIRSRHQSQHRENIRTDDFACCRFRKLHPIDSQASGESEQDRRMIAIGLLFVRMLCDYFKSRPQLEAEIVILRHQLNLLQRRSPRRSHLRWFDRALFIWLYRSCPPLLRAITIVRPETVLRWHRMGFAAYWRWKSRSPGGRPRIAQEVRDLIRRMSLENPLWGATK